MKILFIVTVLGTVDRGQHAPSLEEKLPAQKPCSEHSKLYLRHLKQSFSASLFNIHHRRFLILKHRSSWSTAGGMLGQFMSTLIWQTQKRFIKSFISFFKM